MAQGLEILEAEAYRRALEGVVQPVYRKGKLVGEVRQHSDRMLMFLLAAQAPQKYAVRRGKGEARAPEEEATRRAALMARLRELNAIHLKMVEESIAQGRLERPEGWMADERGGEDGERRRRGDGGSVQSVERGKRGERGEPGECGGHDG